MVVLSPRGRRSCWLHDQSAASVGRLLLAFALGPGTAALHASSLGTLEMMRRDPGFVITFGTSANSGTLSINLDGLGPLDGLLASWLLLLELREVRHNPDVVECVANTDGASKEEDVEEDPAIISDATAMRQGDVHLRVEEAGVLINQRHSAIEGLHGVEGAVLADDSCQVKTELLRMHVGLEAVWEGLLFAGGDLDRKLLGGQVAHDARALRVEVGSPETASNKLDGDGLGLLIAEGNQGVGGLAVDELDAEDFSIGEGRRDYHRQRRAGAGNFDLLFVDLWTVSYIWGQNFGSASARTTAWPKTGMD